MLCANQKNKIMLPYTVKAVLGLIKELKYSINILSFAVL